MEGISFIYSTDFCFLKSLARNIIVLLFFFLMVSGRGSEMKPDRERSRGHGGTGGKDKIDALGRLL